MSFKRASRLHVLNPPLRGYPIAVRRSAVSGGHDITAVTHDVNEACTRTQVVQGAPREQHVLRCLLRPPRARGRNLDPHQPTVHAIELECGIKVHVRGVGRWAEGARLDVDRLDLRVTREEAVEDCRARAAASADQNSTASHGVDAPEILPVGGTPQPQPAPQPAAVHRMQRIVNPRPQLTHSISPRLWLVRHVGR